jgi:hypothetical protein
MNKLPIAVYRDPRLDEYRDNPFITCLPPIGTEKDVVKEMTLMPNISDEEKNMDGRYRVHAIARVQHSFFQPLWQHVQLEEKLSKLIRQGYLGRSLASFDYAMHMQNGFKRVLDRDLDAVAYDQVRSTADSLSLFGCSGCGKTRAIQRVLGRYPQALYHPEYNVSQLVYLKIDCPIDGDLDELCLSFFQEMDRVLGTDYLDSYGGKKRNTKQLLAQMCQMANLHALGMLIIDEVQNLNEARSGGAEKMHNFFVSMTNNIGIPVVLIGTLKAMKLFSRTFRAGRRVTGSGSLLWDRFAFDENWTLFLNRLWKFQWLQNASALTDELSTTMYQLSQGVMDMVIKLFMLSQARAIATGVEQLSSGLIQTVYEEEFKPVHPMLDALRSGRADRIAKYEDLIIPEVEIRLIEAFKQTETLLVQPVTERVTTDKEKDLLKLLEGLGIARDVAIPMVRDALSANPDADLMTLVHAVSSLNIKKTANLPERKSINKIKCSEWTTLPDSDLRSIYARHGDNTHHALKERGLIFDVQGLLYSTA